MVEFSPTTRKARIRFFMLEAYGNKSHFISYDITGQKKAELTKAGLKKKKDKSNQKANQAKILK